MFTRSSSLLFGAALIAAALTPSVKADQWDKKTIITINEPVQMPSCCNPDHVVVLQPGTYVLALVDSLSDRHIVRVFEQDQKTVVTTILAIPNYRLLPTDKSTFRFWETPVRPTARDCAPGSILVTILARSSPIPRPSP